MTVFNFATNNETERNVHCAALLCIVSGDNLPITPNEGKHIRSGLV